MRRKRLVATTLVSVVVGTVLALLAPSALAGTDSESGGSPGNRGWSTGHHSDGASDGDSDD
jgi:hypothetical protein